MTTWFWGDPHFSHKNILKFEPQFRPFPDTNTMDEAIIDNYNAVVKDGDLVFWLGDMFFCNASRMDYICNRLKLDSTRNILIRGNHDKGVTDSKFRRLGFLPVRHYQYRDFFLSHEPISGVNLSYINKYSKENYSNVKNIHAHTHSDDTGLDPKMWQCVSMEQIGFRPISYSQLIIKIHKQYSKQHRETYELGSLDLPNIFNNGL